MMMMIPVSLQQLHLGLWNCPDWLSGLNSCYKVPAARNNSSAGTVWRWMLYHTSRNWACLSARSPAWCLPRSPWNLQSGWPRNGCRLNSVCGDSLHYGDEEAKDGGRRSSNAPTCCALTSSDLHVSAAVPAENC